MEFLAFEWIRISQKWNISAAQEQGDWGWFSWSAAQCSMGRKEGYISDVSHVGDHSRPTPRSAYVIFKSSPLIELPLGHAGGWRC